MLNRINQITFGERRFQERNRLFVILQQWLSPLWRSRPHLAKMDFAVR